MIKLQKLTTTLLVVAVFSIKGLTQESDRILQYIQQYKELAISEMVRTGVPASIKLAQGILETGGGQSDLASVANNHFGIKCKTEWKGETMLHDDDARGECFRKYGSVLDSYMDHSDFLKSRAHYAFLFKLDPTDYEGWAKGLKKAGYATNPAYPQRLMKIIVENNLQQYTLLALARISTPNQSLLSQTEPELPAENTVSADENQPVTQVVAIEKTETPSPVGYPVNKIFTINETKVVFAQGGTSLLALANSYTISLKKLLEFNELTNLDIMPQPGLIFLQKKPKKGSSDFHEVKSRETLYDICQMEGIQLEALLEYNHLQKGAQPAAGQKLYLKYAAPHSLAQVGNKSVSSSLK